jgi:Cu/Ag efflux protein CusF
VEDTQMHKTSILAALAAAALACGTSGAQQPRASDTRREGPIATSHPYEMKGTVQSVSGVLGVGRTVTIARKDAPAAQLHVAEQTRITLNDKPARLTDLREGDEVRALFDFDQSRPTALEIDAKKASR